MSAFPKMTSMSESNNDDVTPEKEYDDTIKKIFAESMSSELLIAI